jgi:hypothetical protein
MEFKGKQNKGWLSALFIGIGIICVGRWMPHPPNFTPLVASILFGAAFFKKYNLHFLLPIAGLWVSDILLNNILYGQYFEGFVWISDDFIWSAIAFIAIALFAVTLLKKVSWSSVAGASISSSIIFYLISNFGVWMGSIHGYPKTFSGLMASYGAGLPFLVNSIAGDLFYAGVFFLGYYLVQKKLFTTSMT